jgi:type I restriction enzyme S subunit
MNKINTARLGDLVEITGGGTPSRAIAEYWGGTIPWVTVKDFVSNRIVAAQESITEKGLKNSASNLIPAESILMPTRMALGKIAINAIPVAINQDIKALHVKDMNTINQNYLVRYLLTNSNVLEKAGKGATVKGIKLDFLKSLIIPLPFLNDQIRIATVLTRAEKLIAKRKESIKALDELLKSTFLEMFGDPVRNEKGWTRKEIRCFGGIITGNTPPRNDDENYSSNFIEWIKTDNIHLNGTYLKKATEYLSEKGLAKARFVSPGALLVACIAGSVESIGRAAIADRKVSFNQQINAIQPNSETDPLFLYWLFKIAKSYIQSHATKGMKKILTKGDFEKILMIFPPAHLQSHFASIVTKIESLKSHYTQFLTALENLYGSLSQRAFKGELDLSHVPLPPDEKEGVSVLINK